MRQDQYFYSILFLSIFFLFGCGQRKNESSSESDVDIIFVTQIGNPDTGESNENLNLTDGTTVTLASGLVLSEVRMNIAAIKLKKGATEESDSALTENDNETGSEKSKSNEAGGPPWEGPYVYDAISGELEPDAGTLTVSAGTYNKIEFTLKTGDDFEEEDTLYGNSLTVSGVSGDVEFTIEFPFVEQFKLSGEEGVTLSEDATETMTVAFQVDSWFTEIDFEGAETDDSGAVVVDNMTNKSILTQFKKNMKLSTKFGKDKDDDGDLEGGEVAGEGEE